MKKRIVPRTRRSRRSVVVTGAFLVVCVLVVSVATATPPTQRWGNPLRGTWSGTWEPESGGTRAVTVRFEFDGNKLVGEMRNPEQIRLSPFAFDEAALTVMAEARTEDAGHFTLNARIEEGTRLNGTLTLRETSGQKESGKMRLTKWTYRP